MRSKSKAHESEVKKGKQGDGEVDKQASETPGSSD